ncbi:MAG: DUF3488 domain-containing protein [Myxococcales bacterium]|nr:DUF3488 domain-containing protein [Myxococcales bacterium]
MRFVVVHKVTSYLMVLTSFVALFISGELHPIVAGLSLLACLTSWFWEPPRVDPARFERLWNGLTLLMLSKTVLDIVLGEPVLVTGAWFVVFLAINKLFNRSGSRDYLQLYVVSFLQMVAATALSSDLAYGVLFLFYIVFTTWTLILFHLKREMEENYLLKYGDSLQGRPVQVQRVLNSRKLVGGRFLLVTSAVSLAVFLGAAAFFFLFPRIGFRFFNQQRPGIAMAGFSDTLELGHFGVIKDDPTVVMRVEFADAAARHALPPYWRGIAFDHYDGRAWTKSAAGNRRALPEVGDRHPVRAQTLPDDRTVRQAIYLEPMETHVLFGLSRLHALDLEGPDVKIPGRYKSLQIDAEGDVHYEQSDEIAFRYAAFSEPEALPPALWEQPLDAYRHSLAARGPSAARYRQLPAGLDPRVAELAARVIGDAPTVGEAIDRVVSHLHQNYRYTLDLARDERFAPLEDFLFVQRAGHCEYFSTAMVILLRTQGIGARSVNGFLGGTWNGFGGYLAVSQGDAHSWVEVYFPEQTCGADGCHVYDRWLTRDPTPPATGRARAASAWSRVLQYADALRMRWYKYVIEYDLQQQVGALIALRDLWRSLSGPGEGEGFARETRTTARRLLTGLLGLLLLAGLASVVWRRRNVGRGDRADAVDPATVAAAALYAELLQIHARRGHGRTPAMTAREFLASLAARRLPGLALATEVVDVYEAARFGGEAPEPARVEALAERLRRFDRDDAAEAPTDPPEES